MQHVRFDKYEDSANNTLVMTCVVCGDKLVIDRTKQESMPEQIAFLNSHNHA